MNKAVAILFSLAAAGCGGGNYANGDNVISASTYFVEVSVTNSATPTLHVFGGSTATLTMESGQRIAFASDRPLAAGIDNFCFSDPISDKTSVSWVLTTSRDTTVRMQVVASDNQPNSESPFSPPDPKRAVTLLVEVKGNPSHLPNQSALEDCPFFRDQSTNQFKRT